VGTALYGENVAPAKVAPPDAGIRGWNAFFVDDVDRTAAILVERGVTLLREPEDRPEGHRAAMFADPGGHVYEISSGPGE
jgi:catechol 2,3-dioxygenase-like lactoylglutathione lyase family enzyme